MMSPEHDDGSTGATSEPRAKSRVRRHDDGSQANEESVVRHETGIPEPVHLIGVGGAGMSGIAAVLARLGVAVTGSDLKVSRYTRHLEEYGVPVSIGHDAAQVGDAALVVISSAIPPGNPELQEARRRGLPVLQRAEMLARIMATRRGVAVAGTHGKTTTSSMITHVMLRCDRRPTFLVGGDLNDVGSNAGVGDGEWLVAEADESDGSLLFLRPEVAVITNVELDHHANYRCLSDVRDVFRRFVALLPAGGRLVAARGAGTAFLAGETQAEITWYGLAGGESDGDGRPAAGDRGRQQRRRPGRCHRPGRRDRACRRPGQRLRGEPRG